MGHACLYPHCVDLDKGRVFDSIQTLSWNQEAGQGWGVALLESLQNPATDAVVIKKEAFSSAKNVILLNCIDNLYGHCLLKLLNSQRHLDRNPEYGLIVIIPRFLRWLVPDGVAEIWTVDISLSDGLRYFPAIEQFILREMDRFDEIAISLAHSHPSGFDITRFSKVAKHIFSESDPLFTFIWREDRLWSNFLPWRALHRFADLPALALAEQNKNVRKLMSRVAKHVPTARFAVTGLGTRTHFPSWIEDRRVDHFSPETEMQLCELYAESSIVVGVHGSNMLLPSAHAGATISLMPRRRWGNYAQDILFQEDDPRMASFRYRIVPIGTDV
ncbi:MAG: hypothetical protein HC802_10335 [Caldilineaceae bacterium]|nr:hypothetical protein [Caldilineaceae bacterium]